MVPTLVVIFSALVNIHTSYKYATLLYLGLRGHQGYNFYAAYIFSLKMYS